MNGETMDGEAQVRRVVDRFLRVFEERDLAALGELFARDEALVFYGTQVNLHFVGWDAFQDSFRRQFTTLTDIRIELDPGALEVRMLAGGRAACAATAALHWKGVRGDRALDIPNIRATWTLERTDERWVIVQMHWSLADGEVLVQH